MDSTVTTPTEETTANEQPWAEQTFDINGEQVSLNDLQKGYMRQSDYTKKTQELSKERKAMEEAKEKASQPKEDVPDDVVAARKFLRDEWVITKKEYKEWLENFQKQVQADNKFKELINQNPDLEPHLAAIKEIQRGTGKAYEDIIVEYGFSTFDKLAKAKSANKMLVGSHEQPKEKTIGTMSLAEYEEWRMKEGIGTKGIFG